MRSVPAAFEHNVALMATYPGMEGIAGTPDEMATQLRSRIADNLVWLHNKAPQILRDRGWHWYDGANRIANLWAERYGMPTRGVAGVLAALSPQKDWYMNVSLAERILDVMDKGRARPWTPAMTTTMNRIYGDPKFAAQNAAISGRTLDEVLATGDLRHAAGWVRVHDETFNDRQYSVLTPEGDLMKPAQRAITWGSNAEIAKAIGVILDPSQDNISRLMGGNHKVRSFYNNIVTPNAKSGDVTIDTHAVAAALVRPLSGNTAEVSDALGTSLPTKFQPEGYKSAKDAGMGGAKGVYGLYADAYRDAASTLGLLPRQLQSITWEAIRLLYPHVSKRPNNPLGDKVRAVWADPNLSPEEKRNAAHDLAGGIDAPSWERPGGRLHDPASRATYKGELAYRGGAEGAAGGGAGGGGAGAVPAGRAGQSAGGTGVSGQQVRAPALAARGTDDPALLRRAHGGRTTLRRRDRGDPVPVKAVATYGARSPRPVYEIADPEGFAEALMASREELGPLGVQVTPFDPADHPGARLFVTDDGRSGFAIDKGDIISVFSGRDSPPGLLKRIMPLARAEGGDRLDAFDTFLPEKYATYGGMKAVARLAFSREHAPTGWDYDFFEAQFGTGEPDIVFMASAKAGDAPSPDTDNVVDTYEAGQEAQRVYLSSGTTPPAGPLTRLREAGAAKRTEAARQRWERSPAVRAARQRAPVAASGVTAPEPGVPTPLYVRRDVTYPDEVLDWAKAQGFTDLVSPDDMHVTVTYSKAPVDVADAPAAEGQMLAFTENARPKRLDKALVIPLSPNPGLEADHRRYREAGASHDYGDDYQPHVTFKYDPTPEDLERLKTAEPFTGGVILSGEVQDTLKIGWRPDTVEADNQGVDTDGLLVAGDRERGRDTGPVGGRAEAGRGDAEGSQRGMHPGVLGGNGRVGQAARDNGGAGSAGGGESLLGGLGNRRLRDLATAAKAAGKSPHQFAGDLRHQHSGYQAAADAAEVADGVKAGPEYQAAVRKYAREMTYALRRSAIGQPKDLATFLNGTARATADHAAEVARATSGSPYAASALTLPPGIDMMPQTKKTLNNVKAAIQSPAASTRTALEAAEDSFFNRFAPIRRLEIKVRGVLGIGAESAFKAVETAVNDAGRNETLMYYGAARRGQYGEFATAPGTVGLHTIISTAAGTGPGRGQRVADWAGYMVARRLKELRDSGFTAPFPFPDSEIATYLAKETPEFRQAADMWKAHNDANVQFLVDTGRITKAEADAMRASAAYVPFYRSEKYADGSSPELDISSLRAGRHAGGELLARDPGIKALKGGDKMAIDNVLTNMIRNSQAMVAAGMRNDAANLTFDLMIEAGIAKPIKGSPSKKPSNNAVAVWRNGKKKWVLLTDPSAEPLLVAMAGLQPLQLGRIQSIMAAGASIFRTGITLQLPFMVRNAIRGAVSTGLMTSGANLTVANNTFTGFRDALRNGAATQAFKAQSGMGGYNFGNPSSGLGKDDILIEFGMAPKGIGYRMRQGIALAEKVGTATELADRVAAYNSMIARGMRPDEAAYQARAVMDYARKGSSQELRAWLPMVPFLNARLQGLSRMAEGALGRRGALGRKQAMMQLALNGLVLTALTSALWFRNASDEERREKYIAEPLHRRLNYHIVYFGDKTLLIPKAFELGHLFSSIPELFADRMVGDLKQLGPGVTKIAADTVGFNLIPAAALPTIEAIANYSFFRGAPIVGMRESDLRARDRTTNASAFSRFIGQQLGISDATGLSPTMAEHFFQGYGGSYYLLMVSAVDLAASETGLGSAPVGGAFGDVPGASALLTRAFGSMLKQTDQTSSRYVEEFYRTTDHITQIYRSAKEAAANGDVEYARRILAEVPATPAAYKLVNRAGAQLTDLNRAIRQTRASTQLTPRQKRDRIEPMIRARNEFLRQVTETIHRIEEQQGATFRSAA